MTSIASIANAIGIADRPGERAVLMAVVDGVIRHAELSNAIAADLEVDDESYDALYVAGGLFREGSIVGNSGRSQANLTRVLWLQFDADLLDWYGLSGRDDASKARRAEALTDLGNLPQDELDAQIALLRASLEETFAAIGLPIHRLDYTGYGLCAYLYLAESDQPRIDDARALHAAIVGEANRRTPHLLDDQVKDAGTRVTRLPGSYNRKGTIPRLVTSLIPWNGDALPLGKRPEAARPVAHMIPSSGPGMTADDTNAFVAAIAPAWNLGQKHAMGLATAAILAKARIPESQALAIVEHLAAGDTKPWDRRAAVVSTYTKMRAGGAIAGYSALANLVDPSALAFVDQLLAKYRNATAGTVTMGAFEVVGGKPTVDATIDESDLYKRRERQVVSLASAPPDAAFYGWFGAYRDAVSETTEAADALHLGASLAVAGAMIGRRVGAAFGSDDVYPMLYMVLVGATGWSRKETAMKRALDQLPRSIPGSFQTVTPSFNSISDISSSEGLADVLEKTPNTMVRLAELTLLFANMERKGTKNLPDRLINLWDAPDTFEVVRTGGRSTKALQPSLSILAATQPGRLADAMTQEHMLSGFANRLTFVTGKPKPAMAEPKQLDRLKMWDLYRTFIDAINTYPQGTAIPRSKKTDDRWNDWYLNEIRKSASNDEESEAMRARHQMMALKVALIYAISDRSPSIELHHLEPAIAFVEWMWRNLIVLMRSWGVAYWSQIERRIEDVLLERGPLRRGSLGKLCSNRKWNTKDFGMVLDALIKNDRVAMDASGICRWIHEVDDARTNADASRTVGGRFADTAQGAESGGFAGDLGA